MSVEYTKIAGDPKFALESPVGSESTGKSAIDEAVEKLESIPISRAHVEKCKQAVKDKLVDKWDEKITVMEQASIRKDMIERYLKYMQDNYPGIDGDLREKYEGIIFGSWSTYNDDFKQNHGTTKINYGQVNFGKSDDEGEYSCLYAYYTAEMVFADEIVKESHPILWGLINITTFEKKQADLPQEVIEAIHTYFRFRALDGFLNTGITQKMMKEMIKFASEDHPSTMFTDHKELVVDKETPWNLKFKYCFVFMGRSADDTIFACFYVNYEAEIQLIMMLTLPGTPFLWGLLQPTENEECFRTFFLYKALDGLLQNGMIHKINFVE